MRREAEMKPVRIAMLVGGGHPKIDEVAAILRNGGYEVKMPRDRDREIMISTSEGVYMGADKLAPFLERLKRESSERATLATFEKSSRA